MTDVLTPQQRRFCMSRIRGKDTRPEMVVRRIAHRLGYRFRTHVKGLPGSPDLVFSGARKVIFVHGCYWHRHRCRNGRIVPQTRREFWIEKLETNRRRDKQIRRRLRRLGWEVLVIWECHTRMPDRLVDRLVAFLDG